MFVTITGELGGRVMQLKRLEKRTLRAQHGIMCMCDGGEG